MSFRATIPGRNADNGIRTRNLWNLTPARLPVAPYPHCRPAVTGRFYKGIKYGSYNPSVEGSRDTGIRTRNCSSQSAVPYRLAIALFGAVWVSPALVCERRKIKSVFKLSNAVGRIRTGSPGQRDYPGSAVPSAPRRAAGMQLPCRPPKREIIEEVPCALSPDSAGSI